MIDSTQWITEATIAHRGLWNADIPENSIRAIELCIEKGYAIEIDVQMLYDGTFVIFHDWTVDRMTTGTGVISHKKIDDISHLRLNKTDQKIPLLREVLQHVHGQVPLLIELKNKAHNRSLYMKNFLTEIQNYQGEYAISSFDPFLLKEHSKYKLPIVRGINFFHYKNDGLIFGWMKKIAMYGLWVISRTDPDFYVCHASMLPYCWIAKKARKKQKPLLIWGVKSEKEFTKIESYIDNTICDIRK